MRLMLAALVAVIATGAFAQEDSRWVKRIIGYRHVCDWDGCRRHPVYRNVYVPYAHPREYTLTYAYREGRICDKPTIEVLSTEHQEETNARNAATKLWMAQVQWKWGGQYMDLENATDVLWRCSASNAHDTISGRLAEGVSKLVGKEGQNVRCQLWARPCTAPREPEGRGRR